MRRKFHSLTFVFMALLMMLMTTTMEALIRRNSWKEEWKTSLFRVS